MEREIFDYDRWNEQVDSLARGYADAKPFPHASFASFLQPAIAARLEQEFPKPGGEGFINYKHFNEQKLGKNTELPPLFQRVINELNGPDFVRWLSKLTGIPDLIPDLALEGGGLHQTENGGFLNVHTDFSSHPHHATWLRRVNLIVYLNTGWQDAWSGHLELWEPDMSACAKKVCPDLNRALIFNTDLSSYHGQPTPLNVPDGVTRKSIALYYFSEEDEPVKARHTFYQPRPEDSWWTRKKIILDRSIAKAYFLMKQKFGIGDALASNVLGFFAKFKRKE